MHRESLGSQRSDGCTILGQSRARQGGLVGQLTLEHDQVEEEARWVWIESFAGRIHPYWIRLTSRFGM